MKILKIVSPDPPPLVSSQNRPEGGGGRRLGIILKWVVHDCIIARSAYYVRELLRTNVRPFVRPFVRENSDFCEGQLEV